MLSLPFALLLAAAAPLPPGTVVVGLSTVDGGSTELTALLPDGTRRSLGTEMHEAGMVPKGALAGDRLLLAVQQDGAEGADVIVHDLGTGSRDVVGQRAVRTHAPVLVGDDVLFVRAAEKPTGSVFDLVRARGGHEEVVASTSGAWLTPVKGAPGRFLEVGAEGDAKIVDDILVLVRAIGKARVRSPALVRSVLVVERVISTDRAELVDATNGVVLGKGIPGMDPLAVGARVVVGAGTKAAALRVLRVEADKGGERLVEEQLLSSERAGVASPRAGAVVDGGLVVAAWLDRGRALPGELWLFTPSGARALLPAEPGIAVEVYGVVGGER